MGPCTDAAVADAVKKALAPQGYRVTLDDGSTVDLWPPARIQTSDKTREDATYPLAPSLFFGVIHFAKNARDSRGNAISAGTYNIRYELQPNDGNHLGTSPTPDFLLLVPAAADTNPARSYSFDRVITSQRTSDWQEASCRIQSGACRCQAVSIRCHRFRESHHSVL